MNLKKPEAVIFDMDGVLVDSEPWHYNIETILFKKLGLDVSEELHHTYLGTAGDLMYSDLKQRFDIPMSLEELIKWDEEYRIDIFSQMSDIKPNPGIPELLKELKFNNIKTGVATSSVPGIVDIILKKCGINSYFDTIVTTDMAGKSKPAPDVYLLTSRIIGVSPSNCVVFEDSFNGVRAAKSASMYCIAYQADNQTHIMNISEADCLIHNFKDINLELIRQYFGNSKD
jgi:HAD superfamily hydrolase (TIGR01509 family)